MINHFTTANSPNYCELLKVKERIPDLVDAVGIEVLSALVMAEITRFMNSYTVVRPMNAMQIAECAMSLINSSKEDRLSLNDLVIFFDGAKQGKYGKVLDHIDQHVIFEMLEVYRQERHMAMLRHREEQEAKYKPGYDFDRSSSKYNEEVGEIRKAVWDYENKINEASSEGR